MSSLRSTSSGFEGSTPWPTFVCGQEAARQSCPVINGIMLMFWPCGAPAHLLLSSSPTPFSPPAFWLDSGHKVLISEGWPTPAHLATWPSCFLHGMRTFLARSRAWFLLVKKVSIFWPWIYNSAAARPSETPTWARNFYQKATHQRAAP